MTDKKLDRDGRPRRVVMVDADDPMREIEGDFVWVEEHEQAIAAARADAYAEGLAAGRAEGRSTTVTIRRRRGLRRRLRLIGLAIMALFVVLMLVAILAG
ncbi:hypothetical protein KLP28_07885 [Nocardioidaceae bacterium]|nr:hypothetical protein KLP28_07885 [Nocardioidaceae bacterium]